MDILKKSESSQSRISQSSKGSESSPIHFADKISIDKLQSYKSSKESEQEAYVSFNLRKKDLKHHKGNSTCSFGTL